MQGTIPEIEMSPIIIGTMRLGEWGSNMKSDELEAFIDACVGMGLVDFDHADIYGHYTEEGNFGRVLKRRPDLVQKLRITSKCGIKLVTERRPDHHLKSYDSTVAHIIWSVENSLKELGVPQLELLLIHRPDYLMDAQAVARAFEKLRQDGKVNHFGVSNFSPSQFSLLNSFIPLVTNQVEISLLHRNAFEDGTLDQCHMLGIIPTAWSPFGGGAIFSRKPSENIQNIQRTAKVIGEKHRASIDQILLAWLFKHPTGIVPIVGSTKIERIQTALAATKIQLSHEEWYQLLESATGTEVP